MLFRKKKQKEINYTLGEPATNEQEIRVPDSFPFYIGAEPEDMAVIGAAVGFIALCGHKLDKNMGIKKQDIKRAHKLLERIMTEDGIIINIHGINKYVESRRDIDGQKTESSDQET